MKLPGCPSSPDNIWSGIWGFSFLSSSTYVYMYPKQCHFILPGPL